MTINLQSIFISSINLEDTSGCQMKEKKSCLKALAWLELAKRCLNFDMFKPSHKVPLKAK